MCRLLFALSLAGMFLAVHGAMTTDNPGCDDCSPTTEDLTSTTTTPSATTTTPDSSTGLVCKFESTTKTCYGGCFAKLDDGVSEYGCKDDLDFASIGFTVTECGTTEKAGQCNDYVDADGVTVEGCMGCCDSAASCNEAYEDRCDYIPNDPSCKEPETTTAGGANLVASLSLLIAACVLWFH